MISVLLATEPPMRAFSAIEGSPLEQRATVQRVDKADGEDGESYAARFDALLPEAEVVLVSPWTWCVPPFTSERWERAGRLRVIAGTFSNRFAGWLNPGVAAARGITVIDTSRSMSPTVAEFGLAMTLNVLRDIPAGVQLVRAGAWRSSEPWDQPGFAHGDLAGRRVGLAGYGAINRRYAQLLRPFACDVMTFDPFVQDESLQAGGVRRAASLVDLASRSEILVVGVPPTTATQKIVGADVIDALPRGAIVIVLTRMAVVDQTALWRRAAAAEIRAAVDVFDPEPPPADASFRSNPWVLPTPHIAGATTQCHRRCFTTACADVLAVLAGEAPRHPVTATDDQLYRGDVEALVQVPLSSPTGDTTA